MFITSYLMGGLGNQMFQISKALSEGFENNIDVVFRPYSYIPMHGNQPTKYKDNIFRNLVFKNINENLERISEPSWSYNKIDVMYYKSVEYYGYYQSSKNFNKHTEKIKSIFKPTDEFLEKIKKLYPQVFEENSTSLHVRRGDYLSISEILPVIDISYIDKSLELIGDATTIFIFSNDKEWVKDNLKYKNSIVVTELEDYEELWMMSLCQNNIMSNSSFSWWGSYLNNNENKKVFAPSIWFGPKGEKDYKDIYEEEWHVIKTYYNQGKILH
jgi:hypothetical protein